KLDEVSRLVHGRKAMDGGTLDDQLALSRREERASPHHGSLSLVARLTDCQIDSLSPKVANFNICELETECLRRFCLGRSKRLPNAARIDHSDPDEARQNLRHHLKGLAGEFDYLCGETSHISARPRQASCESGPYRIVPASQHNRHLHSRSVC